MDRPARSRISARASSRPHSSDCASLRHAKLTVLVATSGDTGGAVAAAFHRRRLVGRRPVVSQGSGLGASGAAALVLGRQRAHLRGTRHVRRLSGHGQGRDARPWAHQRLTSSRRRTASTSAGCFPRPSTTRRPASGFGGREVASRASSFRPAILETWSRVCWPATWGCRLATSCSRPTRTSR